jgi:acetoin utilization deacetylase AcuC-like enzyme
LGALLIVLLFLGLRKYLIQYIFKWIKRWTSNKESYYPRIIDAVESPLRLFIIVIFGHDSHCEDYGDFYLTVNGYREFTRRMKSFSDTRPLLYVLSGGSQPQIAAQAIPAVIESLL